LTFFGLFDLFLHILKSQNPKKCQFSSKNRFSRYTGYVWVKKQVKNTKKRPIFDTFWPLFCTFLHTFLRSFLTRSAVRFGQKQSKNATLWFPTKCDFKGLYRRAFCTFWYSKEPFFDHFWPLFGLDSRTGFGVPPSLNLGGFGPFIVYFIYIYTIYIYYIYSIYSIYIYSIYSIYSIYI